MDKMLEKFRFQYIIKTDDLNISTMRKIAKTVFSEAYDTTPTYVTKGFIQTWGNEGNIMKVNRAIDKVLGTYKKYPECDIEIIMGVKGSNAGLGDTFHFSEFGID